MLKYCFLFWILLFEVTMAQTSCGDEPTFKGEGTYYFMGVNDLGNCSFPNADFKPFFIGALNALQYGTANYCGTCAEVQGPKGNVKITLIDQCPECKYGDIDLSPEAFDLIAERIQGRINISWKIVPCSLTTPVHFYIKEGSSAYWLAVQVRIHLHKIESLEYWNGSSYISLPRQSYNYFLANQGLGTGPFKFRITDVYGNQIIEDNVPLVVTTIINGKNQFPSCVINTINDVKEEIYTLQNNMFYANITGTLTVMDLTGTVLYIKSVYKNQEIKLKDGFQILKFENENGKVSVKKIVLNN